MVQVKKLLDPGLKSPNLHKHYNLQVATYIMGLGTTGACFTDEICTAYINVGIYHSYQTLCCLVEI